MDDKKNERFEAYPRPTETDKQLQNQPEYVDQQPNDFSDRSISDLPANDSVEKQANNPREEE